MERELNFVLKLSLQEIALRRIAIILWSERDVLASINKSSCQNTKIWRRKVESKVKANILKLGLPESLMKKMIHTFKPIGSQILRWKVYHEDVNETFGVPILEKLRWSSTGILEYRETAEALVRSNLMNVVKRYKLACLYCLEDYIPELWEQLPEEVKGEFYKDYAVLKFEKQPLHFCWPYFPEGEEYRIKPSYMCFFGLPPDVRKKPPMCKFLLCAFHNAASAGNKAATEYFFQKLTQKARDASLVNMALTVLHKQLSYWDFDSGSLVVKGNFSEVMCYLLSMMTPEQQIRVFKASRFQVLRCFLQWPWQDFFSDVADVIWTFLPEHEHFNLFMEIYFILKHHGYYIPNLVQNLFQRSPVDHGKYFVTHAYLYSALFEEIFDNQDTEAIKVIFRNVGPEIRESRGIESVLYPLCFKCISEDRYWDMLEIFFGEITLGMRGIRRLKIVYGPHLYFSGRLLEILNKTVESKTSLEDEELARVRKLCCEKEETMEEKNKER